MAKYYKERIVERVIEREMVDDYKDVKLPMKSKFNNGDFITIFQKALAHISIELNLSKGAMKLLLFLISKTEITNEIKLPVQSIAETLKISKGNAYDFLNELKKHNVVVWEQKLKTLRLNYEIGYKGKVKDYKRFQYKDEPIAIDAPKNQMNLLDAIAEAKQDV
jgi:hypothetical protein